MKKRPAIFLDRDGTIVKDVGYINDISLVEFYPYTIKALKKLQEHFALFIITNQSGVSKGLISENNVKTINKYIENSLLNDDIAISHTYYCPHKDEDNCFCKKPSPYFINYAADIHQLDLSKSFIVGDHPSDIECGINAKVTPIYLLSGHGNKHRYELNYKVKICNNILDASNFILSTIKTNEV